MHFLWAVFIALVPAVGIVGSLDLQGIPIGEVACGIILVWCGTGMIALIVAQVAHDMLCPMGE